MRKKRRKTSRNGRRRRCEGRAKWRRLSENFAVGCFFEADDKALADEKRGGAKVAAGADDKSRDGIVIGGFRQQAFHRFAFRRDDFFGLTGQTNRFVAADGVLFGVDTGGDFDLVLRKKLLRSSAGDSTLAMIGPRNGFHFPKLTRL